jgi:hypothetical protein
MELVKLLLIFIAQNDGAGAQPVTQRVHGSFGLAFGCSWTRRLARIAAICRGFW